MKRLRLLIIHLSLCLSILIHAAYEPEYIISKISVSGVLTGKEQYKKLYRLCKGSPFNRAEHQDGIRALEKHLKRQGYLHAHVQARCDVDNRHHTAHVHLKILLGPLFTISSVTCLLHNTADVTDNFEDIIKKLQARLESRLKNAYCSQDLLDAQARMITAYFAKKGYLFAAIEMEQVRHPEHAHVDIQFKCSLHDKKKFTFVGNNHFTSQQLYQLCAEFGKALPIIPQELLVQELRDAYNKQGYFDVAIECYDEKTDILFSINEGLPARIEQVVVLGADSDYLRKALTGTAYNHKKIQECLAVLASNLVRQGYWHMRIQNTQMHKLPSGNYQLEIVINLGPQLTVTKIIGEDFEGLLTLLYKQSWCKKHAPFFQKALVPFDYAQSERPLVVSEVEPYEPAPLIIDTILIGRMRKFLQKQLHEKGYLYTQVTPEFVMHDQKQVLEWQFKNTQKVAFGETRIKGSYLVPDEFIQRALHYKKGDVWNKKRLDETAAALRNFGVFDQVTVFPENIALQQEDKDIIIQLQDSDPFEVLARAGFQGVGTNFTWRGGATYKFGGTFSWKNPRKCADIFSVQFDITRFLRYTTLTYQLAFLGRLPIKQQFKVYSNSYEQPVVLGSREILYRYTQNGFLWGLSQDVSGFQWGLTNGIDWVKISDISKILSRAINFTTRFVDKYIPYFFCEPSIYVSDVDNRLDPLAGWYLVLSSKAFVPFGVRDAAFIKFLFEQGNYIPVHRPTHTVLAVRLRLGTIVYQQFSAIVPPERFYLGGAYSLRGYEPDLAPPLNFYTNCNNELIVVPTGGRTMMNGNFELRFTIFRSLGGTLFTDIGLLTQSAITDIHAKDIIGATGFGLRWNTPVGPLRFDIGWKWKKFPGNQAYYDQASYAWFLTLGNAF